MKTSQHFFVVVYFLCASWEKIVLKNDTSHPPNLWKHCVFLTQHSNGDIAQPARIRHAFPQSPHSVPITLKLPCQGCQRPPMATHLPASHAASHQHPAQFTLSLPETLPSLGFSDTRSSDFYLFQWLLWWLLCLSFKWWQAFLTSPFTLPL